MCMHLKIIFSILFFILSQQMFSQTCCSGGVPLSNNLGLSNDGKGSVQLGLNYDYNNLNTLNAGSSKLDDDSRKRVTNSILANIGYGITDKLSVEGLFTWVNQTRRITQFGNENFTETSGIGDAVLLLKYAFPNAFGKNSLLNVGLGTKIPFGKSDIKTQQGIQLTADLQPGSGAWDGIGWLSASKDLGFRPSATISGSATYRFTGVNKSYLNNTSTYEFGNELQVNVGYVDQFLVFNTMINPGLVFRYRKSFEDKINDSEVPSTGGEWVFIRPELNVQLSPSLSFITRLELPLYSYVEGTQLTPTSRLTTGFTYKFKKKNSNIIK